jgi:hypothetical protein
MALVGAVGCAPAFTRIYPGMTGDEVVKTMGRGPSRAESFNNSDYAAWYYGEDSCLLMKQNTVVAKEITQKGTAVNTPLGGYTELQRAQCVPPGTTTRGSDRQVDTPFGGVRIPGSAK